MKTQCSKCTAPIEVYTDMPEADHDCEACETYLETEPGIEVVISFEALIASGVVK